MPGLRQEIWLAVRPKKNLKWASLTRIKNEIEAIFILAAGDHRHEQLFGTWDCGKPLELAYFAPPDVLQVAIVNPFSARPEFHDYIATTWIASAYDASATDRSLRLKEVRVVLPVFG